MKLIKKILPVLFILFFLNTTIGCEKEYGVDEIMHFYDAIGKSDYGKVKKYIKRYPKIVNSAFRSGSDETSPLLSALAIGDLKIVNLLIENGADIDYQDIRGVSILNATIQSGKVELVNLMLEAGADINTKENTRSLNAYHYALQNPSIELLDLLYEYSKLIDEPDNIGRTPLVASAIDDRPGSDKRTLWFLEKGADYKTVVEMTPDMVPASIHERRNEVVKYLIVNAPSYREYLDFEGNSVSHFSVGLENDEVLDCLLENEYYSNAENDKGETPLEMAVRIERDDMVGKIEAYLEVNP